ncbi:hypothetical protein GUJ93_ZPchr0012g19130 [Zizania palustris]|uniref:Uncharacterized protein n=1 Tax=Zizania palustris TaxID=103762 RepID=A0A8J5WT16_ZIZPA|nr:hypothetical protein GUJ93_ZPchr0012g19130 [Zizania palustris]
MNKPRCKRGPWGRLQDQVHAASATPPLGPVPSSRPWTAQPSAASPTSGEAAGVPWGEARAGILRCRATAVLSPLFAVRRGLALGPRGSRRTRHSCGTTSDTVYTKTYANCY